MRKKKKKLYNDNFNNFANNLLKHYYLNLDEPGLFPFDLCLLKRNLLCEFKNILFKMSKSNLIFINDNINVFSFKNVMDNNNIKPFWNDKIKKLSNKLFLPSNENIDKVDNFSVTLNNSWFASDCYVDKNNKSYNLKIKKRPDNNSQITKCRKITLFLSPKQRQCLRQIFGTYRYYYNRCVSYFNNYNKKNRKSYYYVDNNCRHYTKIIVRLKIDKNPYDSYQLRKILKKNPPEWLMENYPSHLIDQAIFEAFSKFKTCLDMCIKHGKKFQFKY